MVFRLVLFCTHFSRAEAFLEKTLKQAALAVLKLEWTDTLQKQADFKQLQNTQNSDLIQDKQ